MIHKSYCCGTNSHENNALLWIQTKVQELVALVLSSCWISKDIARPLGKE